MLSNPHLLNQETTVIPCGDVLVSIGSMTSNGSYKELIKFLSWINKADSQEKLVMPGENDAVAACDAVIALANFKKFEINLMIDGLITVENYLFYFSPWIGNGLKSFRIDKGHELRKKWSLIPECDFLFLNHPPYGIFDLDGRNRIGCPDLVDRIDKNDRIRMVTFSNSGDKDGVKLIKNKKFANLHSGVHIFEV